MAWRKRATRIACGLRMRSRLETCGGLSHPRREGMLPVWQVLPVKVSELSVQQKTFRGIVTHPGPYAMPYRGGDQAGYLVELGDNSILCQSDDHDEGKIVQGSQCCDMSLFDLVSTMAASIARLPARMSIASKLGFPIHKHSLKRSTCHRAQRR